MEIISCCGVAGSVTTPTNDVIMMPARQVLDWRHIGDINRLTFKFRELSRESVSLIGGVPVAVVPMIRVLALRLQENITHLELDIIRNERSPFEAKLEYYIQEHLDLQGAYEELLDLIDTMEY